MTEAEAAPSKPYKGDRVSSDGKEWGTVDHVDGALCWVRYDKPTRWGDCLPFIWWFHDGLNNRMEWPTKQK